MFLRRSVCGQLQRNTDVAAEERVCTAVEEYRCCCGGERVSGQMQRNTDVAAEEGV
jgi:hypothetical protein